MFPRILRSCHQGKLCQKVEGAKWANATKLLTYVHHSGLNKAKENMSIRRREKVQKWKFETLMPRGSKSVFLRFLVIGTRVGILFLPRVVDILGRNKIPTRVVLNFTNFFRHSDAIFPSNWLLLKFVRIGLLTNRSGRNKIPYIPWEIILTSRGLRPLG